ncbi:Lectin 2 [Medicago truncatula]|uniref:Lectin 2 n=1 Tax=Medicago truncatula TaxID=3880 RepID=A0A072UYN4_MEDTR|nr:legume lectin beta domain protein [Medicago truncatula]RHN67604.1 Lectin 2 [Medicago truncatula]
MSSSNFSCILSISLTFFILLLNKVNSAETTSFSITKFVPDQKNLIFQGDAKTASTGKLELSKAVKNSIDGLAFFIAPIDTKPKSIHHGGYLGVFDSKTYKKSIQTVAVEIDTFYNAQWDPNPGNISSTGRHIGIDVNSIKSISTVPWSLENNKKANVAIGFNGATNVLSVDVEYPLIRHYTLSHVVPLKDVVPEWVRIGFSAATGAEYAAHDILSWSFDSKLNLGFENNINANVSSSTQAA